MDKYEEQAIVKIFLATRSEKHFRIIYNKYTVRLYRLAFRLLNGNGIAAEDVIQEVWVRAIEGLNGFQWQSTLSTWLSGITINCCRETGRKNRHVLGLQLSETGYQHTHEDKIDIQTALSRLPAGYREIFILYDMEGYKHDEIGQMLSISEGTSKSQLFHARKALQKIINGTKQ